VTSLVERQGHGEDGKLVSNIDASLDAVEEIFGALLDISRLDTGAMKPENSSFRIDEVMRQLEVEFAPLAREKGLDLTFVPSGATVRSDRRLLRRLLQNLISNGIKYTPKGRVLVGCRRQNGSLRIEVFDTGLGIPATQTRAIFREFHRLQDGAKVARGLGLGLSIVERISRVLGHPVQLKSEPGRGSVFSVEVPVAAAVSASLPQRGPMRSDPAQLSGMAVLCIDNDPQILDGMEALLGGWGCQVLKAADLPSAIAVIEGSKPILSGLLVDYHLDDGNGIDAIVELRHRFGADLPAILITADRTPRVRDEARARDVPIVNKPVKPAALRALLAQWRIQHASAAE
jgi:CheY-like chemotaxis protein